MENVIDNIILVNISELTLPETNAKIHTGEQIKHIINSIEKFGMNDPVGVWGDKNIIVEGVGRYNACKKLGIKKVPCIRLDFLNDEERRAYAIAHNLTAAETGFNIEVLADEFKKLDFDFKDFGLNFDVNLGDETPRIEVAEDEIEYDILKNPVQLNIGDVFEIGGHRLIYGDSTDSNIVKKLMDGKLADMIFTDPPYNMNNAEIGSIASNTDFIMAAGEMNEEEFIDFLKKVVNNLYDFSKKDSIHFICMNFKNILPMMLAGKKYEKFKQLIVWVKHVANFSSFYRNQHELIFCFQKGNEKYTRNFSFKDYRTNVWNYQGQSCTNFAKTQGVERVHPTMKPIQMIADAIQDCSNSNDIILDLFGGSGSTMVAAHQTNRRCYMVELDEKYVNVIIKRMLLLDGTLHVYCDGEDLTNKFIVSI
jgi:DNA modification methylase